jgi:hypothetical protein
MKKKKAKNKSYPTQLHFPLENKYTHLDASLIVHRYENRSPASGEWPTKDECLSCLWKKNGRQNRRNKSKASDLVLDGALYLAASQLRKTNKPFYTLTSEFKFKKKLISEKIKDGISRSRLKTWGNNRANEVKRLQKRAERFETAWILECLPYLERNGWKVKNKDRLYLGRIHGSLRDAALMMLIGFMSNERISSQPKEMRPYLAYVDSRLKTIAQMVFDQKVKAGDEKGPMRIDPAIERKIIGECRTRFMVAHLLAPMRKEIEEHCPDIASLVDWKA